MDLVTGAMGSLLPKLSELLKEEYNLQKGIKKDVRFLESELESMHAALLKVAEVPRDQLGKKVKLWARDVRELSYDMEDIVDTHQIANEIEDIKDRVQEVADRRSRHKVDDVAAAVTPIDPRLKTLYREATELVGIDGKRDELIKMLFEGHGVYENKLKTISVVGFVGLGKTTLVRAVKDKIEFNFECSAFVPVGRNPDVKKVLRDILLDLDKKKYTKEIDMTVLDERQLIDEVRGILKHKRYLIIIDDVWDEKAWKLIRCAFPNGNNLLITTTRKVSVSKACCSSSNDLVYKMEPLSEDDSQMLFYQRVFSDRNKCPPEFEQVCRDILKKCGGVPLAIITIADLASNKQIKTEDQWYTLLNSIGRGLTEDNSVEEMQRILSFSYYDLPSHLKTCLLYLSIFPKDYWIKRDELIWRWIAEGFVQCGNEQTSLFQLGESYLNELINRSMIQPGYITFGETMLYRVHYMVLDLVYSLSTDENLVTVLDGIERSTINSQRKVLGLSLQNTASKVDQSIPVSVSQVRSITVFPPAINLMPPLLKFDVLRVLDMSGCDLEKSSHLNLRDIGNLFHLRYLCLRDTGIAELPVEIGKLHFLQVLDVRDNLHLEKLPSTVVELRRLMCLLLDDDLKGLPDGMGNLTSMEELELFTIKSPNIVEELRKLTRLRKLGIKLDRGSLELEEAFVESVCNMHDIQSLYLRGSFTFLDLLGDRWEPSRHLRRFDSSEAGKFSTLPVWVKRNPWLLSDLSLLFIQVKELQQEDLQILGRLPALRSLMIRSTQIGCYSFSSSFHDKTERLLLVGADGFHCVTSFRLYVKSSGLIMSTRSFAKG